MTRNSSNAGFTLLEIMLVVSIIALLLSAAIYKMAPSVDVAKNVRTQGDIQAIRTSLLSYSGLNGFFPTTEQGLRALVTRPSGEPVPNRWMQFREDVPKDAWGSDYIYRCPGIKNPDRFDLFSAGPDRKPDTADDDWGG
ncbi:MAG: type II secretion system major pseudopilin GspG [Chthoniobacterales bacterium]|nr:type II secretion system major pseudopilin GspG [Chthoniobacterales bacterium]